MILPGYLKKTFLHLRGIAGVSSLSIGFDVSQQQQHQKLFKEERVILNIACMSFLRTIEFGSLCQTLNVETTKISPNTQWSVIDTIKDMH